MSRQWRYVAIALGLGCVTVAVLPFHIALMEWMLTQGDLFLSFCGQLLGVSGAEGQKP